MNELTLCIFNEVLDDGVHPLKAGQQWVFLRQSGSDENGVLDGRLATTSASRQSLKRRL